MLIKADFVKRIFAFFGNMVESKFCNIGILLFGYSVALISEISEFLEIIFVYLLFEQQKCLVNKSV